MVKEFYKTDLGAITLMFTDKELKIVGPYLKHVLFVMFKGALSGLFLFGLVSFLFLD